MIATPETLMEAVRYFADLSICDAYMRKIKWAGKPICPQCGSDRIGEITARHKLQCKDCRKQFSHKVGTIFEDSPLGLDKWFVAVWCIANARNGISSHEVGRLWGSLRKRRGSCSTEFGWRWRRRLSSDSTGRRRLILPTSAAAPKTCTRHGENG